MDLAEDLRACLTEILIPGTVEIRENGCRVTSASPLSWEVRGSTEKPLLHLWSENCNVTRRVLAITHHAENRLTLAVERFGRLKPERMELVRLEFSRGEREVSREGFCERLRRILAEQFPDETLEKSPWRRTSSILSPESMCGESCGAAQRTSPFSQSRKKNRRTRSRAASPLDCSGWRDRGRPRSARVLQR